MAENTDRILIAESDPVIADFISRQTLVAAGYQVYQVSDGATALSRAMQIMPDVILANLELPGLSGKDLLVGLNSQGVNIPLILIARKGTENEIIQAFRLGAADYLIWPAREAEVLSAVERNLSQVRERRERERLAVQLQQTNQELQQRIRELTTIFSIAKAVTSITDQSALFEKILESVTQITHADIGWFLLREEAGKTFLLVAQHKLPPSLPVRLNQAWDDGISSLVAMSGEPLSIHGEPLKRFKVAALGQSALIVPVKVSKQVIGLLTLIRRKPEPFRENEQRLVESIADFASISLVNARLFRIMEERARHQQSLAENALTGEKITIELLQKVKKELRQVVEIQYGALERLLQDPTIRWSSAQRENLSSLRQSLDTLNQLSEAITPIQTPRSQRPAREVNLTELVRVTASHFLPFSQKSNLSLITDLPPQPVYVAGDERQITQILGGLVSNAIKFCNSGGQVRIKLEKTNGKDAHLIVSDSGPGLDAQIAANLFESEAGSEQTQPRRFGGLGVGMRTIKEMVNRHNGKIWVESKPGQGTQFHVMLPAR
ncbi:ATP-binding protein [Bellilinea sp.]|jgi:signal transduction histidine kinase/DNA-binding response OmpR family regulator|uniref:ATP-binding protein n=1 Tax=Bellilinea sp. TaxID=2838785 RepID=UPI002ADD9E39|nr:ATP-binding protein [Bellilinea sp.]